MCYNLDLVSYSVWKEKTACTTVIGRRKNATIREHEHVDSNNDKQERKYIYVYIIFFFFLLLFTYFINNL